VGDKGAFPRRWKTREKEKKLEGGHFAWKFKRAAGNWEKDFKDMSLRGWLKDRFHAEDKRTGKKTE